MRAHSFLKVIHIHRKLARRSMPRTSLKGQTYKANVTSAAALYPGDASVERGWPRVAAPQAQPLEILNHKTIQVIQSI